MKVALDRDHTFPVAGSWTWFWARSDICSRLRAARGQVVHHHRRGAAGRGECLAVRAEGEFVDRTGVREFRLFAVGRDVPDRVIRIGSGFGVVDSSEGRTGLGVVEATALLPGWPPEVAIRPGQPTYTPSALGVECTAFCDMPSPSIESVV